MTRLPLSYPVSAMAHLSFGANEVISDAFTDIFGKRYGIRHVARSTAVISSKCLALRPRIFRRLGEVADPSAGEARLTDKIIKGFFFKTSLLYSRVPPFLSSCFFLSLSLSLSHRVSFSLSLSLSFCNCTSLKCLPFSLSHDLSSLLSTSRRTIVQSTPALCSICLVAKCSALSIGLDLSKPVDRRDESFQTDSVCPRVSFALPEGKQNSVAPFRC